MLLLKLLLHTIKEIKIIYNFLKENSILLKSKKIFLIIKMTLNVVRYLNKKKYISVVGSLFHCHPISQPSPLQHHYNFKQPSLFLIFHFPFYV